MAYKKRTKSHVYVCTVYFIVQVYPSTFKHGRGTYNKPHYMFRISILGERDGACIETGSLNVILDIDFLYMACSFSVSLYLVVWRWYTDTVSIF